MAEEEVELSVTTPAPQDCEEKDKAFFIPFIVCCVYAAVALLGNVIFLVVYRQYLRFLLRKRPVPKPGEAMTQDETMTTMGQTGDMSNMSQVKPAPATSPVSSKSKNEEGDKDKGKDKDKKK